ncbi:MAG TPA: glycosyltransferase [Burkholderiaceae bacterium]|nr:glycosyltransferase [Burkholderiaceae bacterium]
MTEPLVSVIVPAFNCAAFIRQSIDSVLRQDYAPLEVLVVDDGSTDDTVKILGEYGDRIKVLHQANGGPAAARNRAVRAARGEYLAFVDGDDLWLPGHTNALMSYAIAHPEVKVVFADWLVWPADADGGYSPLQLPSVAAQPEVDPGAGEGLYGRLLFDSVIHIIASLIHRSAYEAVGGFDESLRTGSDYDFWLRVSRKFSAVKLRAPVAVYRQNPASVTNTVRAENNPYRLLKRAIDTYGLSDGAGHRADAALVQRRLAELAFAHGYRHFWRGDLRIATSSFRQALDHHTWHLKAAAYLAACFFKRLTGVPTGGAPGA